MITMENVFVRYENDTEALIDINLKVNKGEFVFLYGPGGSGKSSLLKLVNREILPESGKVYIDDQETAKMNNKDVAALRKRIGFIFQDFRMLWKRSVYENIEFVLNAVRMKEDIMFDKICEALKIVGLLDKKDYLPPQLSYGEQRCLCIARALVNSPEIILADEPIVDLDSHVRNEIMRVLNNIVHQESTTVILTTKKKDIMKEYSHRVIELKEGRLEDDSSSPGKQKKH